MKTRDQLYEVSVRLSRIFFAATALIAWVMLFAAGLLFETVESRLVLAPLGTQAQLGTEGMKNLDDLHLLTEQSQDSSKRSEVNSLATAAPQDPNVSEPAVRKIKSKHLKNVLAGPHDYLTIWKAFAISFFCFTPCNLAILTFCAGLIGGYASNIHFRSMPEEFAERLAKEQPNRHWLLQEPPVSAALRGFVVYLCVIAGLYIAIEDPFKATTSGQYIRLAGLLSALAFLVGYDASRIEAWLKLIPIPGGPREGGRNDGADAAGGPDGGTPK